MKMGKGQNRFDSALFLVYLWGGCDMDSSKADFKVGKGSFLCRVNPVSHSKFLSLGRLYP